MFKVSCLINLISTPKQYKTTTTFPSIYSSLNYTNALSSTHLPLPLYPCSSLSPFLSKNPSSSSLKGCACHPLQSPTKDEAGLIGSSPDPRNDGNNLEHYTRKRRHLKFAIISYKSHLSDFQLFQHLLILTRPK